MEDEDNYDIAVDSIAARKEDQLNPYHTILGHDSTEMDPKKTLQLAGDRHTVDQCLS